MSHFHLHDNYGPEARRAVEAEATLPTTRWDEEVARGLELGLTGADSIVDRRIPTFSRGELPHFAGINTFLKAPYLEDVRRSGEYDVAVLGAPFDRGTTYRSGTRFGPQGIRKISGLYGPHSFEPGVDPRESITIADLGETSRFPCGAGAEQPGAAAVRGALTARWGPVAAWIRPVAWVPRGGLFATHCNGQGGFRPVRASDLRRVSAQPPPNHDQKGLGHHSMMTTTRTRPRTEHGR